MTTPSLPQVLLLLVLARSFLTPILAEALDVWHWRSPRLTAAPMSAVASGGGRYVAVGDQGVITVSEDGAHWHAAESPTRGNLRAVTWAEGQWMAVGDHGEIVTSPDGLRWTRQAAGVFFHLRGVTRGNGLWVAVGDEAVVLTSPDGRAWTQRTSGSEPLRSVTWAEGVFVAGGGREGERDIWGQLIETHPALLLISSDGLQWTRAPLLASGPVTAIAHGAGRFVALTVMGTALISEDGDAWQTVALDPASWYQPDLLAVAHDGRRFVATHSARFTYLHQLWTSPDGIAWSSVQAAGLNYNYNRGGLTHGPAGWVAVGGIAETRFAGRLPEGTIAHSGDGEEWQSVDNGPGDWDGYHGRLTFAGGRFFRDDSPFNAYSQTEQTLFQVSSTGSQWERRLASSDTRFSLPAFGNGRFVCVGREGRMLVSEDALQWQPLASGVTNELTCLVFSAAESRFIAGGSDGLMLVSSNGLDWRSLQIPTTNFVVMAAASRGRIVAGCSRNGTSEAPFALAEAFYVLSDNGVWVGPILETPDGIQGLGAWEEGFYAVTNGRLVHSPDGTAWTTDPVIGSGATVPTSGGGRLLVFRLGATSFFERRAGETTWRTHELPWRVRRGSTTYFAPVEAAYGHDTFLLAHGLGSLIQSEPLQPVAPRADAAPYPAISEGVGSPVTFEATTLGSEPMGYQWRRDGVDIPGATTPSLTRAHAEEAGVAYTCWVTNALGGATIGPFRIVTAEAAHMDLPPHGLGVRVRGTPGARYRLERSSDLRYWAELRDLDLTTDGEATAATGLEIFQPPDPPANLTLFFRARLLP